MNPTTERYIMPHQDLATELEVLSRELDEGQRMIDHGRKTFLGNFPPVRAALNRRQLILDVQRIRVDAAKKYIAAINK